MKKLITTCALLTSVSMISFAQSKQASTTMSMQAEPGKAAVVKQKPVAAVAAQPAAHKAEGFEQSADKSVKALQKEYNLTAEQTQRLYESEKNYYMQAEDLKRNNVPAGSGPYVQMNMQRDYAVKSVLTEAQYVKYEAKKKQQAPAHKD